MTRSLLANPAWLQIVAEVAAVITVAFVVGPYPLQRVARNRRRRRLETYLKAARDQKGSPKFLSLLEVSAALRMNTSEIIDAASNNPRIDATATGDFMGAPGSMLLRYFDGAPEG